LQSGVVALFPRSRVAILFRRYNPYSQQVDEPVMIGTADVDVRREPRETGNNERNWMSVLQNGWGSARELRVPRKRTDPLTAIDGGTPLAMMEGQGKLALQDEMAKLRPRWIIAMLCCDDEP